ncbi:MAG: hypothetical protein WCA46_25800 [Actinocatenispora sp.]
MKRLVGRIAVTVAVASMAIAAQSSAAQAVNRYTVQANSPKPAVCDNHGTIAPGTWIQNKVCGYFVGTAMAGSSFDVEETQASDYHWGRSHGSNNICGWIPPGALSADPTGTADPSCSAATQEAMSHRLSFGKDFNAKAHEATDGSEIVVDPSCGAFYNYYTTSDYSDGSLRDSAGTPAAKVQYRFTTHGSNPAMVIRDSTLGWAFMDRDCAVDFQKVTFHNDND